MSCVIIISYKFRVILKLGGVSLKLGISSFNNFNKGIEREYIITNGLGGFSSSTVIGANIRKYHGILNASLIPPVKRYLLLSKLDETVVIGDKIYNLSSNEFIGKKDEGYKYLREYDGDILPKFTYGVSDVTIKKEIAMEYGKNTTVIVYEVTTKDEAVTMTFTPYVNYRDHHNVSKIEEFNYNVKYNSETLTLKEKDSLLNLKIISNCEFNKDEKWSLPMYYSNEEYRGLDYIDHHFIPGEFSIKLKENSKNIISFVVTIENDNNFDPLKILKDEKDRRKKLISKAGYDNKMLKELVLSSDQFIVHRNSTNRKTVIAGYPWFTDWGRDTMIALPGLTLTTGRYNDAREILLTFIKYIKNGLIPNMFPDENNEPLYNTVDGTLWFFNGVYKFLEYTGDIETVRDEIYPHLVDIIDHHIKGTLYDIYLDDDGLLSAGGPGTQLTWMDVKVDDWVVTPRHGKAVEINALWYNALKIMEELSKRFNKDYNYYKSLSERTKDSFISKFWNDEKDCLYDVLQDNVTIDKIRPNQIIAVSLPFSMLDNTMGKLVVKKVYNKLYTPHGLRTLDKDDEEYKGKYGGDIYSRDGAYHRGTVWPWLIGPFVESYAKVNNYSRESILKVKEMLELFYYHLEDGCIGSISEILDGDEPFYSRGCVSQAWSVSEVLRTYVEIVIKYSDI